jgi:hypothetical protein
MLEHRGKVLRSTPGENATEAAWFTLKAISKDPALTLNEADALARVHLAKTQLGCSYTDDIESRVAEIANNVLYESAVGVSRNSIKQNSMQSSFDTVL